MLRTLRITSIIAVILATGVFGLSVVLGIRSKQEANEFLNSPGIIEEFKKAKSEKSKNSQSQTSPLVEQAKAFALYLTPPPKPEPKKQDIAPPKRREPKPKKVSAKFKLIGTSFYASHPQLSLALIDQPGKGISWVRQSNKIGHLVVEQVKNGSVIIRDGQRTEEIIAERTPKRSLIKGESSGKPVSTIVLKPADSGATKSSGKGDSEKIAAVSIPQPTPEEDEAMMQELIRGLKVLEGDGSEEDAQFMEELISGLEAMRIGPNEAEKLGDLGKELKNSQQDPNRPKPENPKVQKRPRTRRPRRRVRK